MNEQRRHPIRPRSLADAVRAVLAGEHCRSAKISVAVVDDATIHRLNREYLGHNEPTDVLSFLFESHNGYVEGEIVVSADTAKKAAAQFRWEFAGELALYVIHGTLHLFGYDDRSAAKRSQMRRRERYYLKKLGLMPQHVDGKN